VTETKNRRIKRQKPAINVSRSDVAVGNVAANAAKKASSKSKSGKVSKSSLKTGVVLSAEPQTMEELLAREGMELRGLNRGDIVEGAVTEISHKSLYIDINAKTEGLVLDKEYRLAESYIKTLEPGDKVEAYVVSPENETGQIILSLRHAAQAYIWNQLEAWQTTGEIIKVKVKETNRGGAIVHVVDELDGFVPGSQFSSGLQSQLDKLSNKEIEVKIIDLNRQENKIILSEKAVSEAEDIAKKRAALEQLNAGREYTGTVTRVVPFGIFVKLKTGEIEGLVHISEMSWEKISDPQDLYKIGDQLQVQILEVNSQIGKLSLSIKHLTPDPWDGIENKYSVDKQIKGEVTEVMSFGIFVLLEPGISGLIHSSKLMGQTYKPGDKVNVYVESIDKHSRRLSLGLVLTAKPVGYK
jgi:ribosomal protein S1